MGKMSQWPGRMTESSGRSSPFNLVVIDNELFLQHLDGVQITRRLLLSQHHLPEVAFPKNSQKIEIIQADFPLFHDGRWLYTLNRLRDCLLLRLLRWWWVTTTVLGLCSTKWWGWIRLGREGRECLLLYLRCEAALRGASIWRCSYWRRLIVIGRSWTNSRRKDRLVGICWYNSWTSTNGWRHTSLRK